MDGLQLNCIDSDQTISQENYIVKKLSGFRSYCPLAQGYMPHALRVPRAGILLTASFRPHLTMAALAVRLMVPVIRVHGGLSPSSQCACRAHNKNPCAPG